MINMLSANMIIGSFVHAANVLLSSKNKEQIVGYEKWD